MRIAMIAKHGHKHTGVGRYVGELSKALEALGHEVILVHPIVPLPRWLVKTIKRWLKWDLEAFFTNYPVWIRYPDADIYHFSSQNLATLLLLRRPPGKSVITVHDIIPYITRKQSASLSYDHFLERFFDDLAIYGLKRASMFMAVSGYSKQCLVDYLAIPPHKITVTLEGVS